MTRVQPEDVFAGGFLCITGFLAGVFLDAWVVRLYWDWFVRPDTGLPALTLWASVGIGLLVPNISSFRKNENCDIFEKAGNYLGARVGTPIGFALFGWLASLLM